MKNQTVVLEDWQGVQTRVVIWVDCPPLVVRRPRFDAVKNILEPLKEDIYRRVGVSEDGLELFRQDPVKFEKFQLGQPWPDNEEPKKE